MPLPPRLKDGPQQLVVFQQLIHGSHPWFPQLRHFFGKERLPQTGLLMSHATHDMKTIQNGIRLFSFGLSAPIPVFSAPGSTVLHGEVG
jgi:hypothetical protein